MPTAHKIHKCDLDVEYLPLTGQLFLTVPDSCQTSDSFQKKKKKKLQHEFLVPVKSPHLQMSATNIYPIEAMSTFLSVLNLAIGLQPPCAVRR